MRFRRSGETVRNVKFRSCRPPRDQPSPHAAEPLLNVTVHDACPAAQHGRVRDSNGRSMVREQRQDDAYTVLYFQRLAADLMQFRCKPQRLGKRRRMVKITRKPKALMHLPNGLVRITHCYRYEGVTRVTADTRIMAPVLQGLLAMHVASVESKSVRDMLACRGKGASYHEDWPRCVVSLQRKRGIPACVCHVEQLIQQSAGSHQITAREGDQPRPPDGWKKICDSPCLTRQLAGPSVHASDLRCRRGFRRHQRRPQSNQQLQLLLGVCVSVRQRFEQLQRVPKMRGRLLVGRPPCCPVSCPSPIANGLRSQSGLSVMSSKNFRLGLADIGKLPLKDTCYTCVQFVSLGA